MQNCRQNRSEKYRAHWLVAICKTELVRRGKVFRICRDQKQVLQFLDVSVEVMSKERTLVAAAPKPQQHNATKDDCHHDAEPAACKTASADMTVT